MLLSASSEGRGLSFKFLISKVEEALRSLIFFLSRSAEWWWETIVPLTEKTQLSIAYEVKSVSDQPLDSNPLTAPTWWWANCWYRIFYTSSGPSNPPSLLLIKAYLKRTEDLKVFIVIPAHVFRYLTRKHSIVSSVPKIWESGRTMLAPTQSLSGVGYSGTAKSLVLK